MQRVRLALLIGDENYRKRLSGYLLQHEKERFELHIFTEAGQLAADERVYDAVLCADCGKEVGALAAIKQIPFLYLLDKEGGEILLEEDGEKLHFIEKYQDVTGIVDAVLRNVGGEARQVREDGVSLKAMRIVGVYSLAENEYQLPFLVTLASILGEQNRVLVLDLQENSGFSHLVTDAPQGGTEEVLAMAKSNRYSGSRLRSCIGHIDRADYIYPAQNTECLCEADSAMYLRLLQMIGEELDYSVVLINFGSRFSGFFEVLNRCHDIYLMSKGNGLCRWREYEFAEEAERKGCGTLSDKITRVEIPVGTLPTSCERLVEQWKWNEFGDMIRRMVPRAAGRNGG